MNKRQYILEKINEGAGMTVFERIYYGVLPMFLAGSGLLILGLMILRCRPVMISYKLLRVVLPLLLTPLLIDGILRVLDESLAANLQGQPLTEYLVLLSIIAGACVLWVILFSDVFWLYNVTNAGVVDSLKETFEKHNIQYSESNTPGFIAKTLRLSRVEFILQEIGGSVKIRMSILGHAWVRFQNKRHIHNFAILIDDFKSTLAKQKSDYSIVIGIRYVFVGIMAMSIALYILIGPA